MLRYNQIIHIFNYKNKALYNFYYFNYKLFCKKSFITKYKNRKKNFAISKYYKNSKNYL